MINLIYHAAELIGFGVCAYGLAQMWAVNNRREEA